MRTNPFELTRNIYKNQATVGSAFRNDDGAIDLASIMVGVIVIGLIGGVIAATVFAVIPWSQDNAAKQQLDSVASAESAYVGLSSQGGAPASFGDVNDLSSKNLFNAANAGVKIEKTGSGNTAHYGAADRSASGKYFYISDTMTQPTGVATDPTAADGTLNGVSFTAAGWTGSYAASGAGATSSPSASATPSPAPSYTFATLTLTAQPGSPANAANVNGNGNYYGMASSADGNTLVAGSNVGYLYRSTDAGKTWNQLASAGTHGWYGVASSGDGQTILATSNTGLVYLSKDGGATWTNPSALASLPWSGAAMSRNGQYMVVASTGGSSGKMWVSKDGGTTWTQQSVTSDFRSVAISDDGQTIASVSASYSQVWLSKDGGTTWNNVGPGANYPYNGSYLGIAVSADGKTILAGQGTGGQVVMSTDQGTNWSTVTGLNSDNYHVMMNADGTKMLALGGGGGSNSTNVYASVNGGSTFQKLNVPSAQWWSGALSSDGSHLTFASISGQPITTGVWN